MTTAAPSNNNPLDNIQIGDIVCPEHMPNDRLLVLSKKEFERPNISGTKTLTLVEFSLLRIQNNNRLDNIVISKANPVVRLRKIQEEEEEDASTDPKKTPLV